ncbi:MAG: pseudouridine synthase [Alphaproteobacteria bacterium]
MSKGVETARLDRLLANMGYGSRREIGRMAKSGWITLDAVVMTDEAVRVKLEPDLPNRLRVQGETLDPLPGMIIMVHKPVGVTCSHKEAGPLIYDLLPPRWRVRDPALSTVGRLDKETSGLILMTDDGEMLHRIISPKRHVPKRYIVGLDRPLRGNEVGLFAAGTLMLEAETTPLLPAELELTGERTACLTLHEGRYHQVRRMFAAVGNHVVTLHRDRIGALDLPEDLAAGEYRMMTEADIAQIFASPA